MDYEGELAIVIGKDGKDIPVDDALSYVAGYTVCNDVSARAWQRDPHYAGTVPQWCFGKGFDGFAPLGPMIVSTKVSIYLKHGMGNNAFSFCSDSANIVCIMKVLGAADNLSLQTKVNGTVRQKANTDDLVFGVRQIVAFVSQGTTVGKGSIILTGTPGGVILGSTNPVWLTHDDLVEVSISGIGSIRNRMDFI
jgi:2-keto-4-pentenoate hydratase/2-oxohepta-3-ene-1,7-dioic acid hydratase in catechol pathway